MGADGGFRAVEGGARSAALVGPALGAGCARRQRSRDRGRPSARRWRPPLDHRSHDDTTAAPTTTAPPPTARPPPPRTRSGSSPSRRGCPTPWSGRWCSITRRTTSRRSASTSARGTAPSRRRRVAGAARWFTMPSRDRDTAPTGAADIVVEPGREIRAPVTGTVLRAGTYTLYCDHVDQFVVIEPDARPGWEVKVLHIEGLALSKGQRVEAGVTRLAAHARVLPFPSQVEEHTGPAAVAPRPCRGGRPDGAGSPHRAALQLTPRARRWGRGPVRRGRRRARRDRPRGARRRSPCHRAW